MWGLVERGLRARACVCACVRVRVRACACVRARVRVCVCVCAAGYRRREGGSFSPAGWEAIPPPGKDDNLGPSAFSAPRRPELLKLASFTSLPRSLPCCGPRRCPCHRHRPERVSLHARPARAWGMCSASYEDALDMRYEHGRARALSHMHVELGGVGTQAALTPLSGRRTRTSEQSAPDDHRCCSTSIMEQPLVFFHLQRQCCAGGGQA